MTPKLMILMSGLLLVGLNAPGASPSAISGDYVEVRSNEVYTCGCLYSGEQVSGGREAILAWSIRQGEFHGVPLSNTKVVVVIQGKGNLGLEGTFRRSALFVDGATSDVQQQALLNLLSERYGDVLGEIVGVHTAPIRFEKQGNRLTVNAGRIARLVVRPARLPEDAHQGSSQWYRPFISTTGSTLATTEYNSYSGKDFRHQWWWNDPGITGYIGSFALAPSGE